MENSVSEIFHVFCGGPKWHTLILRIYIISTYFETTLETILAVNTEKIEFKNKIEIKGKPLTSEKQKKTIIRTAQNFDNSYLIKSKIAAVFPESISAVFRLFQPSSVKDIKKKISDQVDVFLSN